MDNEITDNENLDIELYTPEQDSISLMSIFIDTYINYEVFINGESDDSESWKKHLNIDDRVDTNIRKIFDIQLKYIYNLAKKERDSLI
jgi:hypothetical protein